ncbi:hypothetical protein R8Z50_11510 [Longispora sp. K20-0274]|uniref:hypothetical protein n=1 Tax=Longispora sp. K20-0274 TaxID=3088255 RepID=UPI003999A7CF
MDELEDVIRSGPVHTALRMAIDARGLSLDRITEHLTARGASISVSSLSGWQRGLSRPERPEAVRALAALEEVLNLRSGVLSSLLPLPRRSRSVEASPDRSWTLAHRMRAELDPPDSAVTVLGVHQEVYVGADPWPWRSDTRIVVRARSSGVDRHVMQSHTPDGTLPRLRAGRDCRLGRVRVNPEGGLTTAELLFAPLAKGETYPVRYSIEGYAADGYHGMWFRSGGVFYDLTIRFAPDSGVRSVHRVWRLDSRSELKDVADLRLIDGRLVHHMELDLAPGFYGIRWTV